MPNRTGHRLGSYRLTRLLGGGGFGEVYAATHLMLEREAAIKVLWPSPLEDRSKELLQEAQKVAQLRHQNIVQIYDFGLDAQNNTPYLVMEYLPQNLDQAIPLGTVLHPQQVLAYLKQIAAALDYAHEHQVIHLDLKPKNVLLSSNGEVVLADFGIAQTLPPAASHITLPGFIGSHHYSAPEQFNPQKPGPASDQYAVGCMVFQWLTGKLAFEGSFYHVGELKTRRPPPSLVQANSKLPLSLERVVAQALAQNPKDRFLTVKMFARAFERAITIPPSNRGEVQAGPPFHARDLIDEEAIPAWARGEPLPALSGVEGWRGRELIDEEALPEWMREDAPVGLPDLGKLRGSDLVHVEALPAWLRASGEN